MTLSTRTTLLFPLLVFSLLVLFFLAGCSTTQSDRNRVDYKAAAIKVLPLEVPPDLTSPAAVGQFIIPNNVSDDNAEAGASFSEFNKDATRSTPHLIVLPAVKDAHIERSGMQRWLVMHDKAENLWPSIKTFWVENGFTLVVDNPAAGVMETDFLENRGNAPQDGVRKIISKVFDRMYSSGEKDMYRTRLERTPEGHTEIYISHRGLIEMQEPDQNGFKWRSRGNDAELEAAMLQMLLAKLGGHTVDTTKAQPASEAAIAAPAVETKVIASSAKLTEVAGGGKVILLQETFDKSWRKVGLALDQAGIEVHDKDRANGMYFLSAIKNTPQKKSWLASLAFWRNDDKPAAESDATARYQVTVRASATGSEVGVTNQDGRWDARTQQIIDTLFQQLNK